jgi:cytidine deaminase
MRRNSHARPEPAAARANKAVRVTGRSKQDLIRAAARAREFAVAPYSRFKVGAALLVQNGRIVTGVNVESASFGLTCCAERVALFNALSAGEIRFDAMAVVARVEGGPMLCGACRQLLAEYAPRIQVFSADVRNLKRINCRSIEELLPAAFLHVPEAAPDQIV